MGRATEGDQRLADIFAKHMVASSNESSLEDLISSTFLSLISQTFIPSQTKLSLSDFTNNKHTFKLSSLNLYILSNTELSYHQTGFRVRHLTIKGLPEKQPSLNVLQVLLLFITTLHLHHTREKVYHLNQRTLL